MRVIIIDDEKASHLVLERQIIEKFSSAQILKSACSVEEGYKAINKFSPDLVFLDVEMSDGTGFDLLQKFDEISFQVIFVTAHNQYAQRAIKFGALDYLLKPIVAKELDEAILRAEKKLKEKVTTQQLQLMMETFQLLQQKKLPSRLAISTSEGIIYKQIKNIISMEAKANYTEFTFADTTKKLLASVNLGAYQEQFGPYQGFMRVHRSHLVNLRYVESYIKTTPSYIQLKNGHSIRVAKKNKELIERELIKI